MGIRQIATLAGCATAVTLSVGILPAQAAFLGLQTSTSTDPIRGIAPLATMPFQSSVFSLSRNQTAQFTVQGLEGLGTRGKQLSAFGVLNVDTGAFISLLKEDKAYNAGSSNRNDWLGTCGESILTCTASFTFEKGVQYQLGLKDLATGALSFMGVAQRDQYTFSTESDELRTGAQTTVSAPGSYILGFEDGGYRAQGNEYYYDYQDWVIKAQAVPEPATLAGLGIVAGACVVARRRKNRQAV